MTKKWTVLAYMAGDNNLTEEMVWSIKEMKEKSLDPGFDEKARVIVQFDPRGAKPRIFDFGKRPGKPGVDGELLELGKELNKTQIANIVGRMPEYVEIARSVAGDTMLASQAIKAGAIKAGPKASRSAPKTSISVQPVQFNEVQVSAMKKMLAAKAGPALKEKKKRFLSQIEDLESFIEESSAAPEPFEDFVVSHVASHKADYKMVVLSGHGSGAVGDFLTDDNPRSSLSIKDLANSLESAKAKNGGEKIEILGLDSCLMSMAEVCYQVHDSVAYLVGAEGFVRNAGWPYRSILEAVQKESAPKKLAEEIVEKYILYYQDYEVAGLSTDLAACNLGDEAMTELIDAVGGLSAALSNVLVEIENFEAENGLDNLGIRGRVEALSNPDLVAGKRLYPDNHSILESVLLAHYDAQCYNGDQYVDLWDLCDLVKSHLMLRFQEPLLRGNAKAVSDACEAVKTAVESVVVASCYSGAAFQHSHGLSIYFPWASYDSKEDLAEYAKLKFATHTNWHVFLEKYLKFTRRERRNKHSNPIGEFLCFDLPDESLPLLFESSVRNPKRGTIRNPKRGTIRGFLLDALGGSLKNPPEGFHRDKPMEKPKE